MSGSDESHQSDSAQWTECAMREHAAEVSANRKRARNIVSLLQQYEDLYEGVSEVVFDVEPAIRVAYLHGSSGIDYVLYDLDRCREAMEMIIELGDICKMIVINADNYRPK